MTGARMEREAERACEWDCTQLIYRFYGYLDEGRYDELAGLFTDDGVWVRLGRELVGPAQIRTIMTERADWLTVHVVTNVRVAVLDKTRAETTQYVTLYRHEGWDAAKGPAPVVLPLGILRHRDQLVRERDIWKFKRKTSRAIMADRQRVTHYDK